MNEENDITAEIENGESESTLGSEVEETERLAFSLLDLFIDRLAEEYPQDSLTADDIKKRSIQFKETEVDQTLAAFRSHFEACIRARQDEIWDQTRHRPFDRVLVKRFSNLFQPEAEETEGGVIISRRMLPGFFLAFQTMASSEFFNRCQLTCKGILAAKRQQQGGGIPWKVLYEQLYDDPDANDLVNDLLFVIADHFTEVDKRLDWMLDMINSHLPPIEEFSEDNVDSVDLDFEKIELMLVLRAMFSDIEEKFSNAAGQKHLLDRYGQRDYTLMASVIGQLHALR